MPFVYIVAQEYSMPFFFGGVHPCLLGVMQSREAAERACVTPQHFYIEWSLGAVLSSGDALSDVERRIYPRQDV